MISLNAWNMLFIVINLLILFIAIKKLFFKPIQDIIAKRQAEADEQFAKASEEMANAQVLKDQYEQSIKDMEAEKKEVISEARSNADAEYNRIVKDAEEKADKITEDARKEAEREKTQIIKSAEKEIADFVVNVAAKIVGENDKSDMDSNLYNKFLDKAGD